MQVITRRGSLALGLGMAVTACGGAGDQASSGPAAPAPTPTPTPTPIASPSPSPAAANLAALAATRNMRFGSTFAYSAPGVDTDSFANPGYAAVLEANCSILVPENELKWAAIRPSATAFDFTRADAMLAFAQANGMAMRGHNLLWYDGEYDPAWLSSYDFGGDRRAGALALVRNHVETTVGHYGSSILSWDVVNEAVDPATGGLRTNTLANAVGNDTSLIDLAFRTARATNPGAQLVYNDYMDWASPATHRDGVLALLKGFKDRGVPVDALGVQSHLSFYSTDTVADLLAVRQPVIKSFLDQVVALGYQLVVTEMDINDFDRPGDTATRDADVAALAKGWLDVLMGYPQLHDVLVWGMVDKFSWLQSVYKRADGQPLRPDPYDASFQPKPFAAQIAANFQATATR